MNEERSSGIILRTRPLTETSLIVHWLTKDLGRIATVAKGARRPKSPFRGKLDLFHQAELSLARSRRSTLHVLREISLRETHPGLRRHLGRLRQASYAATLIELATEIETPLPGLFELFTSLLRHLGESPGGGRVLFSFEIKLLDQLGLSPLAAASGLASAAQECQRGLLALAWRDLASLQPPPAAIRELHRFLARFIADHLGRVPPGRDEALSGEDGE